MNFLHRTWAEINLDALAENLSAIKKITGGKDIMAVVKANAYGHDDRIICGELRALGVKRFAVSNIWEAEDIREILPGCDILIFGYTGEEYLPSLAKNDFIQTIGSLEYAEKLSAAARSAGEKIRSHIKINTGMTRAGIDTPSELSKALSLEGLRCEGIYTHFSVADSLDEDDLRYTARQQEKLMAYAKGRGLLVHSQNSGGVLYHQDFEADIVRAGVILYGYMPNTAAPVPIKLSPVMTLKSTISQLKTIPAGTQVSYGRTYTAPSQRRIAVIPAGYADGYSRRLSEGGAASVNGALCPIVGRICMDQFMLDVTDAGDVKLGDVVELYSSRHKETGIEYIADRLSTIPYELVCNVGHRVPRVAVKDGVVGAVARYGHV